jgi:uncharacterized repeat protein (TIGR03803 family)
MTSKKQFGRKLSHGICMMLTLALITAGLAVSAEAATEKVIHTFNVTNGAHPGGDLIADANGNLYGVTYGGGNSGGSCTNGGCGVVFQLSKALGWKETVLHRFSGGGTDGSVPLAGLTFDGAGNLYGTTSNGGPKTAGDNCGAGCGTVFKLSPKSGGGWTYSIIYFFKGQGVGDGLGPNTNLVFDGSGNLYGTTSEGGTQNLGAVFELSPSGGGWSESVLYSFAGSSAGQYPFGGLIFDGSGNLYGTTSGGGSAAPTCGTGCGVVYELSPGSGGWSETVLHPFNGTDGFGPTGNLIFDGSGNLYGVTQNGGSVTNACSGAGCGVVYELSPASGGWSETVLHNFTQNPNGLGTFGGSDPSSSLTFDSAGNLYGTAFYGGLQKGPGVNSGVAYKLSPGAGGWTETVLHAFFGGAAGSGPTSGLTFDGSGHIYGTTQDSSHTTNGSVGIVFEITP